MLMPYAAAMSKSHSVAADLDAEALADLKRLAKHFGCSVEHLVATAVMRFLNDEIATITEDPFAELPPYRNADLDWDLMEKADADFAAFIKRGEDAIAQGDFVSHEELMEELRKLDKAALDKKKRAA